MNLEELKEKYDKLQEKFGSKTKNSVYGGGCEKSPELCLVFMNPTARNIATAKSWNGVRYQWLGTKQVWKFLSLCNLFDESLNFEIQKKKSKEWTEEFCVKVYDEVERRGIYIT